MISHELLHFGFDFFFQHGNVDTQRLPNFFFFFWEGASIACCFEGDQKGRMGKLTDAQKQWLDEHWDEFAPAEAHACWRQIRVDGDSAVTRALKAAKARAREVVPSGPDERRPRAPRPEEKDVCVACMGAARSYCFVPCGHLCLCATCVQHPLCAGRCPMCKRDGTPQRVFEV
jgi:hypothetical protein